MKNIIIISVLFLNQFLNSYLLLGQSTNNNFYNQANIFFKTNVKNGLVNYKNIADNKDALNGLVLEIEKYKPTDEKDKEAFLINVYNIFVIKLLVDKYPVKSPMAINGFYKNFTFSVLGKKINLDNLEANELRKIYKDPRLHFVLVCGAIGCPPIQNFAFITSKLDEQLNKCATEAINKDAFVKYDQSSNKVTISEIFKWYEEDFKASGGVVVFINKYRAVKIPLNASKAYSTYNWEINQLLGDNIKSNDDAGESIIDQTDATERISGDGTVNNIEKKNENLKPVMVENLIEKDPKRKSTQDFTPSVLYQKGEWEYKFFNNLYTQTRGYDGEGNKIKYNSRGSYFSSINQTLFGVSSRINLGFDFWIKSVRVDDTSSSPLNLFTFENGINGRTALANLGPKIKFQPFKKLSHLSVQSTFLFPIAKSQEGIQNEKPYLSEQSYIWITQIFYDYSINKKFQLFFQVAPWLYIKQKAKDGISRTSLSSPLDIFFSYFLTDRLTFYIQQEYWPNYGDKEINSWFRQEGIGAKFQIVKGKLETEASATKFSLGKSQGAGATFNFGLRFIH